MTSWPQRESPVNRRELRVDVDDEHLRRRLDAEGTHFSSRNATQRRSPFDWSPPLKCLRDLKAIRPGSRRGNVRLHDMARGAALKCLVQIEIVGVVFEPVARRRHLAMHMIGSDPKRIVVRMI